MRVMTTGLFAEKNWFQTRVFKQKNSKRVGPKKKRKPKGGTYGGGDSKKTGGGRTGPVIKEKKKANNGAVVKNGTKLSTLYTK